MCGRYYIDDETSGEIEKIVKGLDKKIKTAGVKDIHPSEDAIALIQKGGHLEAEIMRWGFQGFQGKNLIINARAEGALEKKTFCESILHRRCVIPAKGFYEWNKQKEKYKFSKIDDAPLLFMAGCFNEFQGEKRFVILTTEANTSVSIVHDRMPLILNRQEIEDWLLEDQAVEFILHKTPEQLKHQTEYEQISFF